MGAAKNSKTIAGPICAWLCLETTVSRALLALAGGEMHNSSLFPRRSTGTATLSNTQRNELASASAAKLPRSVTEVPPESGPADGTGTKVVAGGSYWKTTPESAQTYPLLETETATAAPVSCTGARHDTLEVLRNSALTAASPKRHASSAPGAKCAPTITTACAAPGAAARVGLTAATDGAGS